MLSLHGGKQQVVRSSILKAYKAQSRSTLIATDVAARGLDIADIAAVINFDCAKNIDTHVHRIGRTGRLSKQRGTAAAGLAHTLILPKESDFAARLVDNFDKSQQVVPPELLHIARTSSFFRRSSSAPFSSSSSNNNNSSNSRIQLWFGSGWLKRYGRCHNTVL